MLSEMTNRASRSHGTQVTRLGSITRVDARTGLSRKDLMRATDGRSE
jgi:hypothetical protein